MHTKYCKTLLISTYVFSGLATEQVLIFGAVLIFGGYDKAEAKILQGRSLFNPVLSAHKTQLCMFQWSYFQDTGVLIFGGYVLSGHCNQQQISVKTEGVLIYGVLRYSGFTVYNYLAQSFNATIEPPTKVFVSPGVKLGTFMRVPSGRQFTTAEEDWRTCIYIFFIISMKRESAKAVFASM